MAQNFVKEGERLTWTNGTGSTVSSGSPVFVGGHACIALSDIADGDAGELATCGVWKLPKKTPLAISQGDALFWDSTPGEVTKTVTDVPLGMADEAADSAGTTVNVHLNAGSMLSEQAASVAAMGAFSALTGV
jgi:predicted RecA/RadA family phage recombinase